MNRVRVAGLAAAMAALTAAAACAAPDEGPDSGRPSVVVTTTIWGGMIEQLAGEDVVVEVLMQPGQDPHAFAPSAQQAAAIAGADLLVANGLGLEEGLHGVLEDAANRGVRLLEIGEELAPIVHEEDGQVDEDPDEGHDEGHGPRDPHVWLDPVRMADAAPILARALGDIDDVIDDATWVARGEDLRAAILDTHADVERTLAAVPDACRKLVTNHDSLSYFAGRYGFEIVGTVIPGTSTTAGASAAEFAALAETIRDVGVPAIFTDSTESDRLAQTLAQEVGRDVAVVELHTGALAEPGSGADTWQGLMTANAIAVAEALSSCGGA